MNIGIYKPFKKVYFIDDTEDTAAWSYEVVNVAKIFAERGHSVSMLSETDLTEPLKHKTSSIKVGNLNKKYDRIILFSGVFNRDKKNIIERLSKHTNRLDYLFTDLRLKPYRWDLFSNIYTQATQSLKRCPIKNTYGGVAEFILYNFNKNKLNKLNKSINYYFGGTERGRLKDYLEYVYRPDCKLTGKSDTLHFDNRVDRKQYMKLLDKTKFSITIADEEYNENHFITPRPYENMMHNIISFVDAKFDPDEHIISHNDWRRVNTYVELRNKMQELSNNPINYHKLLQLQKNEIKDEYINGDYVYNLLR